ncbi:MAG: 1-deoxy-D-xylulose-5-phosphate reductoisomerase [Candidatus Sumerlaeota bacterium]
MSPKKRAIVLGSTGSIGTTVLQVARDFSERFDIVGLSACTSAADLAAQIEEFQPSACCLNRPEKADDGLEALETAAECAGCDILTGRDCMTQMVEQLDADLLVVATVGIAGLEPTLEGIGRGMDLALANKEVLVVGGEIVMARAAEAGVEVIPIDSEHSALAQCLAGAKPEEIDRLILTASGGPFLEASAREIEMATPEEALSHPTWDMGRKITIDSATLMNKGFEVIEACHLFGVAPEYIDVVVHPQSAIHSLVEFIDGSILAQLGPTDMYLPVQTAMTWPERVSNRKGRLSLSELSELTFEQPDTERFPCLRYAYEAIRAGGVMPAALNAADEVAVERFLDKEILLGDVPRIIRSVMDAFAEQGKTNPLTLENLRAADRRARDIARNYGTDTP